MPGKKDDNQLNIFDHGAPQTSTRKIQDLGNAITDGLKSSDIASAKQAAQEQEALLQKLIAEKKNKNKPDSPPFPPSLAERGGPYPAKSRA